MAFMLVAFLFFNSNTSLAKKEGDVSTDLSKEYYNDLVDEGYLPKDISYDEWVEMNDESLFDDLDVPNAVLDTGNKNFLSNTFKLKKGDILISNGTTHTKVYRVSNSSAAGAGTWASNNYNGMSYSYGFTGSINSKNPTYCSKIVWQAYNSQGKAIKPDVALIMPYHLPDKIIGAKALGIL